MLKEFILEGRIRFGGRIHRQPDPGFDSKLEHKAAEKLLVYNRTTGPLAGQVVVRFLKDGDETQIYAWMSPHFFDPIQVIITNTGSRWREAAHPDSDPKTPWRSDFKEDPIAEEMVRILRLHLKPKFKQLAFRPAKAGLPFTLGKAALE